MLIKCLVIIGMSCIFYMLCGIAAKKLFRLSLKGIETFLLGFFVYFGIFQTIALPLILSQQRLSLLAKIWLVVLILLLLFGVWCLYQYAQRSRRTTGRLLGMDKLHLYYPVSGVGILVALLLLLQLYYMLRNGYNGWDTAYYIGNMNTSVYTDTMYIFDGNSGVRAEYMSYRYCLSSFYMHGAAVCQLMKVPALIYCRYVIPTIGWLISNLILFEIGKRTVGKLDKKYTVWFLGAACMINFSFRSIYTTSEFLLTRSAEAKSYCANIIVPMIFLLFIALWEEWGKKEYWVILFFVAYASNAISFSSLMLVPVLLTVLCGAVLIVERKLIVFRNYLACMAVPVLYGIVYYMFTKGYISIMVR